MQVEFQLQQLTSHKHKTEQRSSIGSPVYGQATLASQSDTPSNNGAKVALNGENSDIWCPGSSRKYFMA